MTSAFEDRRRPERPEPVSVRDQRISAEVRAEFARQKPIRRLTQAQFAFEMFGENQQWFNRRLNGLSAFSGAELLIIADALKVDVVQFMAAGRTGPAGDSSTAPYVGPYLSLVAGDGEESDIAPADLRIAS
jgi:hypothetical protein